MNVSLLAELAIAPCYRSSRARSGLGRAIRDLGERFGILEYYLEVWWSLANGWEGGE